MVVPRICEVCYVFEGYVGSIVVITKMMGVVCEVVETFFHGKLQTAKCHVSTALRSRLQFAVHV